MPEESPANPPTEKRGCFASLIRLLAIISALSIGGLVLISLSGPSEVARQELTNVRVEFFSRYDCIAHIPRSEWASASARTDLDVRDLRDQVKRFFRSNRHKKIISTGKELLKHHGDLASIPKNKIREIELDRCLGEGQLARYLADVDFEENYDQRMAEFLKVAGPKPDEGRARDQAAQVLINQVVSGRFFRPRSGSSFTYNFETGTWVLGFAYETRDSPSDPWQGFVHAFHFRNGALLRHEGQSVN